MRKMNARRKLKGAVMAAVSSHHWGIYGGGGTAGGEDGGFDSYNEVPHMSGDVCSTESENS